VWGSADPERRAARTGRYLATLTDSLLHDPEHESVYVAYSGDIPVSYARLTFRDNDPFAGLWGGSTLEAHRGKGFYTALLATRLQEARQRGVRYLRLDASDMSRPIVEKHGFGFVTATQPFHWHGRSR
jgi:GNAT superfamily N-acetyltransferase